jgi:FXSXX-COOH protein
VDVSGLPITDLYESGDPALTRSVQRLLAGLNDANGIISAFQSYTS